MGLDPQGIRGVFRATTAVVFFSSLSVSASLAIKFECPQKFVGKVVDVKDPEAPLHSLSKKTITLKAIKAIHGVEKSKNYTVKVLEHGPISLELDKEYLFELNDSFVCKVN